MKYENRRAFIRAGLIAAGASRIDKPETILRAAGFIQVKLAPKKGRGPSFASGTWRND